MPKVLRVLFPAGTNRPIRTYVSMHDRYSVVLAIKEVHRLGTRTRRLIRRSVARLLFATPLDQFVEDAVTNLADVIGIVEEGLDLIRRNPLRRDFIHAST